MSRFDIETDVLVLGGGLAGLRAAIAARRAGARVLVVVKGRLGRSGCSAMTTAGYAACLPGSDDSLVAFAEDMMRGGGGIGDPVLVDILCREAAAEAAHLEALGGVFQRVGGTLRVLPSGDHSRNRVLLTPNSLGTDLTVPLADHAEALGVAKLEGAMAVELLHDEHGVAGAVVYDTRRAGFAAVAAGATILATGGAGRLFAVTSNPVDVTGDGFALAAAAGALLRDMEFIQFYPWRCIDPFDRSRVSIQPSTFVLGATLHNAQGERFMQRFNPDGAEIATRDISARGIFSEIRDGRGVRGGVRLDLSPLSPEAFAASNPKLARYLQKRGIDYATYPFIVAPEAHFWMGGVAIDANGASSVPRLLAAGETAGGIHGGNRLNSNALPDTQVFGARAGQKAAEVALARRRTQPARVGIPAPVRDGGFSERDLAARHAVLQARMWEALGILRSAPRMQAGLLHVQRLGDELRCRGAADAASIRPWYELCFLCGTAELSLTSALFRTESRAAHFREDFPVRDDARWCGSVTVNGRPGALTAGFAPQSLVHDAA
jgi:fumarate reductase (CoM/CoB) subunit A